ncbi:hypothetical protein B296_00018201 [Ensete ventricosum]|uniref:Uncharacterized protein n=1 Tax=Ensete ventricosum TaxID=4639 RepID=A0A427AE49_ENSVE|nr:hypothetical protein B296_00018201 [Ensete ventricosum]
MARADAKALQALEAMKSHHDFDSTVSLDSLASIRKRFSILNEYVLHAPGSGQRPYQPCPGGFNISIDALEAGLRFPLHLVIGEYLRWWRVSPGGLLLNLLGRFQGRGTYSNNKGWKARFLFVSRRRGWDFGIEWLAHPISNVLPNLSDEETNLIGQLKGILSASRAIRSLTEKWLVEAGLSPASHGMPYLFTYEFRCLISRLMTGFAEMVCMSMMRDNPQTGGGHPGAAPSVPASVPPPPPAPRVEFG